MKFFMKSSFNVLHDSPAMQDDYESMTKSLKFLLLFCAVRWIEDVAVVARFIEVWPNIRQIMNFGGKTSKVKTAFQQKLQYFRDSCFR